MTGVLNMNGQQIVGLENPTGDDEACNKKYVYSNMRDDRVRVKLYIDGLVSTKLDSIGNRLSLFGSYNVLNIQKDDTSVENIFDIGAVINKFLKENDVYTNILKSVDQFFKSFNYTEKMYEKCMEIFGDKTSEIISDIVNLVFYTLN